MLVVSECIGQQRTQNIQCT